MRTQLFHGLHPLHVLICLDRFKVPQFQSIRCQMTIIWIIVKVWGSRIHCGKITAFVGCDQAVNQMFNYLSINKEDIMMMFLIWWITSAQTGRAQSILKEFVPRMKSGSHLYISEVVTSGVFVWSFNTNKLYEISCFIIISWTCLFVEPNGPYKVNGLIGQPR